MEFFIYFINKNDIFFFYEFSLVNNFENLIKFLKTLIRELLNDDTEVSF